MRPLGKVKIVWSANFAYAIGLIATDGNLSPNKRTISLTSKDREQIENCMKCLGVRVHIGYTVSGYNGNRSYRIQIGDVLFCQFLESIGITQNKSKTIGEVAIPEEYFFDFLRGCFEGKGVSVYQLKYAKAESLKLLPKMYYNPRVLALTRKRLKIEKALKVIGEKL